MIVGIDYGSKMAGTTVIAFEKDGRLGLIGSKKNQDADQLILDFVEEYEPTIIGLDAPLSLPGVYTSLIDCNDYFYRACDKEVKAMSPMFLGGLTARAIKLKAALPDTTEIIEVYPGQAARALDLAKFAYKKKEAHYKEMLQVLDPILTYESNLELTTSHQFDALLALYIAKRFADSTAHKVGDEEEGVIYY